MSFESLLDAVFLRSQGLTAGLALGAVMVSVPLWQRAVRCPSTELPRLGTAILAAIVVGRIAWLTTTARPQLTNPIDVVRVNTGLDMLTTAWVFALSCTWLGRRHRSALAQYAGWALLLAPATYAAGCLLRRDCAGRTAPPPFGVTVAGYSEFRLPIGLYEALALITALAVTVRFRAVLLNSPYYALALLGLIEWTIEFGRIEQLTRATLGVRSVWLASSVAAFLLALAAQQTAGPRHVLHRVVQSVHGKP